MKKYFSDEQIVELVLTIAVANFTNRVNDALLSLPIWVDKRRPVPFSGQLTFTQRGWRLRDL